MIEERTNGGDSDAGRKGTDSSVLHQHVRVLVPRGEVPFRGRHVANRAVEESNALVLALLMGAEQPSTMDDILWNSKKCSLIDEGRSSAR